MCHRYGPSLDLRECSGLAYTHYGYPLEVLWLWLSLLYCPKQSKRISDERARSQRRPRGIKERGDRHTDPGKEAKV